MMNNMNNFEKINTARGAITYVRNGLPKNFGADRLQLDLASAVFDMLDGAVAILRKNGDAFELVVADRVVTGNRIDILNAVEDVIYGEANEEEE